MHMIAEGYAHTYACVAVHACGASGTSAASAAATAADASADDAAVGAVEDLLKRPLLRTMLRHMCA